LVFFCTPGCRKKKDTRILSPVLLEKEQAHPNSGKWFRDQNAGKIHLFAGGKRTETNLVHAGAMKILQGEAAHIRVLVKYGR